MPLSNEVHKFTRACEHLIAGMAMFRPLTEDERLLIKFYCNEVLTKVDQPQTNSRKSKFLCPPEFRNTRPQKPSFKQFTAHNDPSCLLIRVIPGTHA